MQVWRWLSVYTHKRILFVIILGVISGLPLALTASTLSVWLTEEGITKTAIGLFAAIGTPYALKFLWAPLVDQLHLPFLTKSLGRRRGWLVLIQVLLCIALCALGLSNPAENPWSTALLALIVATLSATQDIVIDAYRVELLDDNQQGAGAAAVVFGYRMGMLASGAGALFLAEYYGWFVAYASMALFLMAGMLIILLAGRLTTPSADIPTRNIGEWVLQAVIMPFRNFSERSNWLLILALVILYKFGDAFAGFMTNPFLIDIGFSKVEIATIVKTYGLFATLAGAFLGGSIVHRMGIFKSLLLCGFLQMFSNLMFVLQAYAGHDSLLLTATISIENLSGGMGTAAFVAYISALCNRNYTATQYALLSALAVTGRTWLTTSSGWFVDILGWANFFMFSTILAIPGIILLIVLRNTLDISPYTEK